MAEWSKHNCHLFIGSQNDDGSIPCGSKIYNFDTKQSQSIFLNIYADGNTKLLFLLANPRYSFAYPTPISVSEFMYERRFVFSECDIYVPDKRANLSRYEYAITSLYCFLCSYLCIYIYSDGDVLLIYFLYDCTG